MTLRSSCWEWTRYRESGYGRLKIKGKHVLAHRYFYETVFGKVPEGLQLDHLCRNRWCCNPDHLEPVSQRENILRGEGLAAQQARRTRCIYGHPFPRHRRVCLICQRRRYKEWHWRQRCKIIC